MNMTELTIIKQNGGTYINSREVADVIGKRHDHLLRDIRGYIDIILRNGLPKVGVSDFFVESTYKNAQNKEMPCYLISKPGCEIIANKFIGEKGTLFTIAYVKRFNEMEIAERAEPLSRSRLQAPRLGEYNACARIVIRVLKEFGALPEDIIHFLKELYIPLGIDINADARKEPDNRIPAPETYTAKQIAEILGIFSVTGNPHAQAISCILNENLFIGQEHKTIITFDAGDHVGVSVQYDEYAVESVKKWLLENNLPDEVYGFSRTYSIRYDR
jgi:Rha family phage regulatory protein